jgi:hypothetical protein
MEHAMTSTSGDLLEIHGERWMMHYITGHVQPSTGSSIFLKDKNGQEHSVTPYEVQLPAREGHLITVGYAAGTDGSRYPLIAVNHNTGDTYVRNDVIQQQICGQTRMQKSYSRNIRLAFIAGGAVLGFMADERFPVGNAIMGALAGLFLGWLVGYLVGGITAAKSSYDRMNAFLKGPELADIKSRIAQEKY